HVSARAVQPACEPYLHIARHTGDEGRAPWPAANFNVEARAGDGDPPITREAELRTAKCDLQHRRGVRVSNKPIREPRRPCVHWPADGHTPALEPPAAAILDRREHARPDDLHGAHRNAPSCVAARRANSVGSIGTKRTRSPACILTGGWR